MDGSSDGIKCTISDGEVWMHLDGTRVHIPSHILHQSKMLMDVLSSAGEPSVTRNLKLAAPQEWLQAWAACFIHEEARLGCAAIEGLMNCLLVCFMLCPGCLR
jgi:hypothetical protein